MAKKAPAMDKKMAEKPKAKAPKTPVAPPAMKKGRKGKSGC